jgi:hypothetical protein
MATRVEPPEPAAEVIPRVNPDALAGGEQAGGRQVNAEARDHEEHGDAEVPQLDGPEQDTQARLRGGRRSLAEAITLRRPRGERGAAVAQQPAPEGQVEEGHCVKGQDP